MGRPIKIAKSATIDSGFNNPAGAGNTYGVVGGDNAFSTPTILCRIKIGANAETDGWIVGQKGKSKFLVSDGTNTGVCYLADLADTTLTDNTMTITVTKADTSTVRLAYITNHWGLDFSNNQYVLTFNAAGSAPAGTTAELVQVASA